MRDRNDRRLERVGAASTRPRNRAGRGPGADAAEPDDGGELAGTVARRDRAPTIRLGSRDRGPGVLVGAVLVFLAIAWIKQWPAPPAARLVAPDHDVAAAP